MADMDNMDLLVVDKDLYDRTVKVREARRETHHIKAPNQFKIAQNPKLDSYQNRAAKRACP